MKLFVALILSGLASPQCDASGQPASSLGAASASYNDLVVYGDSSGAVVAAVAAKREGRSVIWLNPTGFAGGMSASGLGATDFLGYRNTFGGIASEFYDGVARAYKTNYVRSFEPHVGKQVFEHMLADAGVTVVYNEKLDRTSGKGVSLEGKRIKSITTLSGKTYYGKMYIDATYVGDLMAAAGVTYTVGREPESQYGEDLAGVRRGDTSPRVHYRQRDKDHFVKEVDPYIKRGDPASGLLPHIHRIEGLKNGQGDKKIQAYNYRVCLTTNLANRIPIERPPGYREIDHELLLRNFEAGDMRLPALIEPLAGGQKVDWNNMHAVGSDFPGANWEYPEASYERRHEIERAHETYIRGFLWTLANNPRVPETIRKRTASYGLPRDEFTDNGGWPWMIYIREARRMVGDYVMTQADCEGKRSAPDPVGLGSFGMDSHVVQHFVTENGKAQNDGVIWHVPPKPYGVAYRSIIPAKGECENLFSPICLSASHVAHGSIRMEPVFMALSQSAAIAAGLALDSGVSVQEVPYPALLEKLEAAKQIVRPAPARAVSGASDDATDKKASSDAMITVAAGDLPIILSAPHGGRAAIPGAPERKGVGVSKFNHKSDSNTDILTEKLADALERKLGERPYVVIARFHRKYLDVNRRPEDAFESGVAKATYDAYHAALAAASKEVTARWGRGIVLDIHGQGSKTGVVFRGTQNGKTVSHLLSRSGREAVSGETSLVGQMVQQGFAVAPPVGSSDPEAKYTGGTIVGTHGSSSGGTIDAIQLEFGPDHRDAKTIDDIADRLASAIAAFAKNHLPAKEQETVAGEASKQTGMIAVGVYIDKGAGPSANDLLRALEKPGHVSITKLTADQIRAGGLDGLDVLVHPGGSGSEQGRNLDELGRVKIRAFVQEGGGFIGICAGAYLASAHYPWSLNILDAKVIDTQHWNRGNGTVDIELTATGREILRTANQRFQIHYAQGPLLAPANRPEIQDYEELASFKTEIAKNGAPEGVMIGTTAIARSRFGQGRIMCFSPHPEMTAGLEAFVQDAIDYVNRKWAVKQVRSVDRFKSYESTDDALR